MRNMDFGGALQTNLRLARTFGPPLEPRIKGVWREFLGPSRLGAGRFPNGNGRPHPRPRFIGHNY